MSSDSSAAFTASQCRALAREAELREQNFRAMFGNSKRLPNEVFEHAMFRALPSAKVQKDSAQALQYASEEDLRVVEEENAGLLPACVTETHILQLCTAAQKARTGENAPEAEDRPNDELVPAVKEQRVSSEEDKSQSCGKQPHSKIGARLSKRDQQEPCSSRAARRAASSKGVFSFMSAANTAKACIHETEPVTAGSVLGETQETGSKTRRSSHARSTQRPGGGHGQTPEKPSSGSASPRNSLLRAPDGGVASGTTATSLPSSSLSSIARNQLAAKEASRASSPRRRSQRVSLPTHRSAAVLPQATEPPLRSSKHHRASPSKLDFKEGSRPAGVRSSENPGRRSRASQADPFRAVSEEGFAALENSGETRGSLQGKQTPLEEEPRGRTRVPAASLLSSRERRSANHPKSHATAHRDSLAADSQRPSLTRKARRSAWPAPRSVSRSVSRSASCSPNRHSSPSPDTSRSSVRATFGRRLRSVSRSMSAPSSRSVSPEFTRHRASYSRSASASSSPSCSPGRRGSRFSPDSLSRSPGSRPYPPRRASPNSRSGSRSRSLSRSSSCSPSSSPAGFPAHGLSRLRGRSEASPSPQSSADSSPQCVEPCVSGDADTCSREKRSSGVVRESQIRYDERGSESRKRQSNKSHNEGRTDRGDEFRSGRRGKPAGRDRYVADLDAVHAARFSARSERQNKDPHRRSSRSFHRSPHHSSRHSPRNSHRSSQHTRSRRSSRSSRLHNSSSPRSRRTHHSRDDGHADKAERGRRTARTSSSAGGHRGTGPATDKPGEARSSTRGLEPGEEEQTFTEWIRLASLDDPNDGAISRVLQNLYLCRDQEARRNWLLNALAAYNSSGQEKVAYQENAPEFILRAQLRHLIETRDLKRRTAQIKSYIRSAFQYAELANQFVPRGLPFKGLFGAIGGNRGLNEMEPHLQKILMRHPSTAIGKPHFFDNPMWGLFTALVIPLLGKLLQNISQQQSGGAFKDILSQFSQVLLKQPAPSSDSSAQSGSFSNTGARDGFSETAAPDLEPSVARGVGAFSATSNSASGGFASSSGAPSGHGHDGTGNGSYVPAPYRHNGAPHTAETPKRTEVQGVRRGDARSPPVEQNKVYMPKRPRADTRPGGTQTDPRYFGWPNHPTRALARKDAGAADGGSPDSTLVPDPFADDSGPLIL